MDEIEQKVHEVVLRVARQRSEKVTKVENSHRLTVELGLTSLDFARIIAILEMELGADPFGHGPAIASPAITCSAITDMRTVGDLCQAYRATQGPSQDKDITGAFTASESRAAARRPWDGLPRPSNAPDGLGRPSHGESSESL
jgi:acyl carrier protein